MDTCKIRKGLYQFTAIDDCTRLRVLGLYPYRSSKHAIAFLREKVLPQFAFPIQRLQTGRGQEFIAMDFQDALRERRIKFRPNRPFAPHLNGKVERSQRTDRMEFWPTVDRKTALPVLEQHLQQWQHFYNGEREHSSLGKTPLARLDELKELIPLPETVSAAFDPDTEGYRTNYRATWKAK